MNITNTQVNVKPHVQGMDTITGLNAKIEQIESSISSDGSAIDAVEGRLDTAESDISSLQTAVSDRYTKSETDTAISNAVSSVYRYKGSVANYAALPTSGQIVGDVYNVEAANSTHGIKAGDNVAWTGSAWDVLSGVVDLSNYYTKTQVDEAINAGGSATEAVAARVTTLEGKMTTAEGDIDALESRLDTAESDIDAVEGRMTSAETAISNRYTKTEINTMSGLSGASAGFVSNTIAEGSDGKITATAADNVSIATAETNNKAAIANLATAHNNVVDRLEALEAGDDEKTKFFQINFSGTSHTYSNDFITADSFVNYNFGSTPAGYVEFSVETGKIKVESSTAETDLVIKVSVTKNPGSFIVLAAD